MIRILILRLCMYEALNLCEGGLISKVDIGKAVMHIECRRI